MIKSLNIISIMCLLQHDILFEDNASISAFATAINDVYCKMHEEERRKRLSPYQLP